MGIIEYPYSVICFTCARSLRGSLKGKVIGMWPDYCPVCKTVTSVAVPGHDFGIYYVEAERLARLMKEADQKKNKIKEMLFLLEALARQKKERYYWLKRSIRKIKKIFIRLFI